MQDFKNLKVWQKAHELALLTYRLTADFPREELFGLRNSLRKTSIDIPAFIAEGCAKTTDGEFARTMSLAIALANRLEYYTLMALDLKMLSNEDHSSLTQAIVEVRKMLSGFSRALAV
ncbi:MAG: four helix bundle protein [Pyrinomonadaceae bacterium]